MTVLGYVPSKRLSDFLRQITLVMGQRNELVWDIPAQDSFELNRAIYRIPPADYKRTLDELTDLLELGPLLRKPVRNLSLGERMKCELAAALLHRPQVVFLDEPTIGLDVTMQRRIRSFVAEYNRRYGATVLLTSHYMADVEALCRRVVVIHHGRLLFDGDLSAAAAAIHVAQDHRGAGRQTRGRSAQLRRGRLVRGRPLHPARSKAGDRPDHRATAGRPAGGRSPDRRPAHRGSDRASFCSGDPVRADFGLARRPLRPAVQDHVRVDGRVSRLAVHLDDRARTGTARLSRGLVDRCRKAAAAAPATTRTAQFAAYFIVLMLVDHVTYTWIMYEYEYRVREGMLSPALLRPVHPIHADIADNVSSKVLTTPFMLVVAAGMAAALSSGGHAAAVGAGGCRSPR